MKNTTAVQESQVPTVRSVSRRKLAQRLAVVAAALGLLMGVAGPASAAKYQWNALPGYGTGSGYAIIDGNSTGTFTSSAWGRVQITARSYCVKVQYAPFAYAALDGGWSNTSYNCSANATRVFNWSDSYHLGYNGFKFRICTTTGCGSSKSIAF